MAYSSMLYNVVADRMLCALKLAAESDNILSDNSRNILVGFGHNRELQTTGFDKPGNLNQPQLRIIAQELINGRHFINNVLNNRQI